ncbi:MAG: L-serine ammonia-lyase, iron-sulfur-dependent, subunit alpha, partial [Candidatus Pacebacteria bacterium]|nr:L-serine ammonia-lyase, iron-sulfur-dependent, subunit alpha [Candidatus Paceibacterota bacterium]
MMDSLRNLFRIGPGPSSSHTMAPARAARQFHEQCTEALLVRLHLFGSLAATGRGHLTDKAAVDALHPLPVKVLFHPEATLPKHPNGMRFEALNAAGDVYSSREVYSVGGGALSDDKESAADTPRYPVASMADMLEWSEDSGNPFWKLVADVEGEDVWAFLKTVYEAMNAAMVRGLEMEGILPGGLRLPRRAQQFKRRAMRLDVGVTRTGRLSAYALAVAEENAAGGVVATAPTCGSSGVVPAVLRFLREQLDASEHEMLQALAIAGLVGNVVKHNASISGAEVGCQGEIGTACAMADAAAAWLLGGSSRHIEYAAGMGLGHHFGLA